MYLYQHKVSYNMKGLRVNYIYIFINHIIVCVCITHWGKQALVVVQKHTDDNFLVAHSAVCGGHILY